ncbi:MAG TPA: EcoRI family type II restriction endonuclease [Anaerohalosphaeraceae bacterium]|nr:EcoRI family type II restriction endonuclease [Anaerohalosphaeraceae bacterium]HOL88847.1 EcoRI family type II restriction endonuclease [Anaerohalosphaeraceae bacterium]HPP55643.1 EcoRI family type II restriction endonuclease [Anaerohalosphaeraceae bacterium]
MSRKEQLRAQRKGTIINVTSKKQEEDIIQALRKVVECLQSKYKRKISLCHQKQWYLKDIVSELEATYHDVEFHYFFDKSSIKPDGGFLYIQNTNGLFCPILIAEVKNQGTNDLRMQSGLPKQAKGNAIERLGKNLIGLRVALMRENIFPFVCFGYGCDFDSDSSILDRITTMAMFGRLNKTYLFNEHNNQFNRGSFYFRKEKWTIEEMKNIMADIAERSILYYFSKYGKDSFLIR